MKKEEKISIIIPIYNSEVYLDRCLNSIIKQTYENFEVLLINDGSTDASNEICEKYCKADSRFIYFYNENHGVAYTRNFGISHSTGDYITFVDSDDYISSYYLEILYKSLINTCSDISICMSKNVFKHNAIKQSNDFKYKTKVFSSNEALENMLCEHEIDTSFWGKLYKTSLFNNITIKNYKIFEDLDTLYKIILKSKKICYVYTKLYFYFVRLDSLSHNHFSKENLYVLEILDNLEENLKNNTNLKDAVLIRKMNANFYIIRNTKKCDSYNKQARNFIKKNRKYVMKSKIITRKLYFALILSYISFSLIKPMYNLFNLIKKLTIIIN